MFQTKDYITQPARAPKPGTPQNFIVFKNPLTGPITHGTNQVKYFTNRCFQH